MPLSEILFVLIMELLVNAIRTYKTIKGIGFQQKTKISLFVDDTLLMDGKPSKSYRQDAKALKGF